jgi:hypothetical protein
MSTQAREALRHLTAALEAHLEAVESRRSAEDATVDDAFDAVAEAFERYEDELDSGFGESLPIVLDDDPAEAFDDDDSDDDSDDDDSDDDSDDDDSDDDDSDDDEGVVDEDLDGHATEDEDEMDDDIEAFDLR